jgi:hypothetical protein
MIMFNLENENKSFENLTLVEMVEIQGFPI